MPKRWTATEPTRRAQGTICSAKGQYAAEASLILEGFEAAGKYMSILEKSGIEPWSLEKEIGLLKKIYPGIDFDTLLQGE